MEKDFGYRFHQQKLNILGFPSDIAKMNNEPICRNPYFVNDSTLRNVPSFPVPGLGQHRNPIIDNPPAQKRFIVFDQSFDGKTFMYTSGVESTFHFETFSMPKPPTTYNLSKEVPRDSVYSLRPNMNIEDIDNNAKDFTENEDMEELNALLYSDTESYSSEDDEEKSTGHSPSTITENGTRDLVEEIGEEVDSFFGPTKRQRVLDGGYAKTKAESSSGNSNKRSMENVSSSLSGGKRSRKERIRETVRILKSLIPNTNGKDTIVVIDEAIHYLRSLKVKAKALGLDAL